MRKFLFTLGLIQALRFESISAQQKMNLDDIAIKGELHNDGRLRTLTRDKYENKKYFRLRKNYRQEILQSSLYEDNKKKITPTNN
ncbi:MAG: hypothetical protein K1X29_03000 [Bdellovibrionales bacterium]|nr:hypothetical protein [Bdellovibrionales bacterium]